TYLSLERHLSIMDSSGHLLILIAGSFVGYLVGATAMDRFGRRYTLIAFAVISALASSIYFFADLPEIVLVYAGFPLGVSVSGRSGCLGSFLSELFPTRVRSTAQGFVYNLGRVVAASYPPLIGAIASSHSLAFGMAVFALCSFGCVVVAALFLPETKGLS